MNKDRALTFVSSYICNTMECAKQAGKLPPAEIEKLQGMFDALMEKGESLPESFYAELDHTTKAGSVGVAGHAIFCAIHAA